MRVWIAAVAISAATAVPAQVPRQPKPSTEPLSNAFVTAAESVVDSLDAVDLAADPVAIDSRMGTVRTAQANLAAMVFQAREKAVKDELDHAIFTLSACRIQAADGVDLTKCRATLEHDRQRVMESLGRQKRDGVWDAGAK